MLFIRLQNAGETMPHKDPIASKAYHHAYRMRRKETHAERDKEYNRKWAKENPDRISAAQYRYRVKNPQKLLFLKSRARAAKAGVAFTIKQSDIVIPLRCPIFGFLIDVGGLKDFSPSLDRIDNRFGYVPGNVQVISWRANRLKGDATLEEMVLLGKAAAKLKRGKK